MTQDSIAERAIEIVHQHFDGQIRGAPTQDPYRSDWFKLCREAWENGLRETKSSIYLSAQSIIDVATDRWLDKGNPPLDEHQATIRDQLYSDWNAWCYAFDKLG